MQKSAKFKHTFQASVAESLITDAWRPKVDVAMLPAVPQNDGMRICCAITQDPQHWRDRAAQMRALAVTTTNLEAAGLMTNDVFAENNMLADRAASRPLTKRLSQSGLKSSTKR